MLGKRTANILKKRATRKKLKKLLSLVLTLAFVIGFVGVLYYTLNKVAGSQKGVATIEEFLPAESQISSLVAEIQTAVEEGNYEFALERIKEGLETNPDENALRRLQALLMDDLEIDFRFNYLPGRRRQISARSTSTDLALTDKDPYYMLIHVSEKCYIYLCQLQSSGKLVKLFPNSKYVPTSNPVPGGPIRIPDGYDWFYLDDLPGTETVYLIASRWQQDSLEKLFAQLESERDAQMEKQIIQKIISRLESEGKATDDVPGLVYAKHQFKHEVSQP